jgi:uncharacterized hydrophobic protein (TIGR00271 family)
VLIVLHLRLVTPADCTPDAVALLRVEPGVTNLIVLPGAAVEPPGDVVMADVAREVTSAVVDRLRELGVAERGSMALETVDTAISAVADQAVAAAPGHPSDAVVWEEVTARTSEEATLSGTFVALFVVAALIAAAGILLDSPILVIGGMVVGPEFGPLAGVCVAVVQRRLVELRRSAIALAVGFPAAMAAALIGVAALRLVGVAPDTYSSADQALTGFISHPDFWSFFVATAAGVAGMLSLTSAKSGALVGVLISVTTVPSAANVGVALAYADGHDAVGAGLQLVVNVVAIVLAGTLTLFVQRRAALRSRRTRTRLPAVSQVPRRS